MGTNGCSAADDEDEVDGVGLVSCKSNKDEKECAESNWKLVEFVVIRMISSGKIIFYSSMEFILNTMEGGMLLLLMATKLLVIIILVHPRIYTLFVAPFARRRCEARRELREGFRKFNSPSILRGNFPDQWLILY